MNVPIRLSTKDTGGTYAEVGEADVKKWRKTIGERVEKGEILLSIETSKAEINISAPVSGVLGEIFVAAGETWFEEGGEKKEGEGFFLPPFGMIKSPEDENS